MEVLRQKFLQTRESVARFDIQTRRRLPGPSRTEHNSRRRETRRNLRTRLRHGRLCGRPLPPRLAPWRMIHSESFLPAWKPKES